MMGFFEYNDGMMRNDCLNIPYLRRNFANNVLLFENVPSRHRCYFVTVSSVILLFSNLIQTISRGKR